MKNEVRGSIFTWNAKKKPENTSFAGFRKFPVPRVAISLSQKIKPKRRDAVGRQNSKSSE